jgi:hypothetical protein
VGRSDPWQIFEGRIIVVANSPDAATLARIKKANPNEVLVLTRGRKRGLGRQSDGTYHAEYRSSSSVGRNNAQVAVLTGRAALGLRKRNFFRGFQFIALGSPIGWLCAIPGLLRYAIRGELTFVGTLPPADSGQYMLPFLVFENQRFGEIGNQRLFGPPDMEPTEMLGLLSEVDYVLLRWHRAVLCGETLADVDLLVSDAHLDRVRRAFSQRLGLFPIDVYSQSGSGGHAFKSAPYYPPHAARWLLDNATSSASGIRHLSGEFAYLAFAYHLLFHKTETVPAGTENLASAGWLRHLDELLELARSAQRRLPQTFSDIEEDLAAAKMMPPLDTIGFYSRGNEFLVDRYASQKVAPGLSVFLIREFGIEPDPVPEIRRLILAEGFVILHEGVLSSDGHAHAIQTIRGGNWYDRHAPGRLALPRHFYVCMNPEPVPPSSSTLRRYPRLDDERLLIKRTIRDEFTRRRRENTNIVHVSDNSAEAREYVAALGLEQALAERIGAAALAQKVPN